MLGKSHSSARASAAADLPHQPVSRQRLRRRRGALVGRGGRGGLAARLRDRSGQRRRQRARRGQVARVGRLRLRQEPGQRLHQAGSEHGAGQPRVDGRGEAGQRRRQRIVLLQPQLGGLHLLLATPLGAPVLEPHLPEKRWRSEILRTTNGGRGWMAG